MHLAHIGIAVKDLQRSLDFYSSLFSCKYSGKIEMEHVEILYLEAGNMTLELLKYAEDSTPRETGIFDHIAFQVNNMEEHLMRLKAAGIQLLFKEPRSIPGGKIIMFCLGPDGERIELVQG